MLQITSLCLLWICGLTPTAISLLVVIAMAGKPQPCERPNCVARTYSWELLLLPVATASPFVSGFFIARMSGDRKERRFKSKGGANEI